MKELFIGKRLTDAFIRSHAYYDGEGNISEASDEEIDSYSDDEWDAALVEGVPYYDIDIPLDELLSECKITEQDLDALDMDEDECLVLEDGKEVQFIEDINDGFSFVTVRLYYNQEGIVKRTQYVGHQHDDIGCDELLLELPTIFHERCFSRILKEFEDNGLVEK